MPQYLVAGYLPDDFDPSQADEATGREIHALEVREIFFMPAPAEA